LGFFTTATLPTWIATHEKHLNDNGNNGHYIGDKVLLYRVVGLRGYVPRLTFLLLSLPPPPLSTIVVVG
jgi:hypothetical protein